jgi:hypothetical protein
MKKNASLMIWFLISFIFIHATNQSFLQFDSKDNCPKVPMSPLGLLISLAETDEGYNYESKLSEEERKPYQEIVFLKRSFSSTMSYIPQNFTPEKEEYWDGLNHLLFIFIIIAIFPTIFILFYIIVRFICKKCTGPQKISQVNKLYRNLTWAIMIICTIVTALLFAVVLIKSVKVGNSIDETFSFAVDSISKSDNIYNEVNTVVQDFKNNNFSVPSEDFMSKFKKNIELYVSNTKSRSQKILDDESQRTNITIFVFTGYYFLILLAFLFFFFRLEKLECLVSILLFFAIPGIIILEGYNAKFFFYYGDLCDSVIGALYENQYPVADQSLGFYYNCFNTETKASLYNIRYRLYENVKGTPDNDTYYVEFKDLKEKSLDKLFKCEIVTQIIPKIEADFCKDSLDNMYTLILLMTWIVLFSLGVAIGSRRLQVLIWKKRNEIESMIQNQEILY